MEVEFKNGYVFYVISYQDSEGNVTKDVTKAVKTNLILDRNICEDGTLTSADKQDKCFYYYNSSGTAKDVGPVTAMEKLNLATSLWKDELLLNEIYNDEGSNFSNFKITGKARMPYNSEASPVYSYDYMDLQTNPISGIAGYWTLSTYPGQAGVAWYVRYDAVVSMNGLKVGNVGIRPVITLKI